MSYVLHTQVRCWRSNQQHVQSIPDGTIFTNHTWSAILSDYENQPHDGWIVVGYPVTLGLCNRMLDITSTLLLAMATNRTMWVEWEEQLGNHTDGYEEFRMSGFNTLFNSSLHDGMNKPPDNWVSGSVSLDNDGCFLHNVMNSPDLNVALDMTTKVVTRARGDWWGGLLLKNKHYKATFPPHLTFLSGFPVLFRALFNPRTPSPPPVDCGWLIQYRVKLATSKWRIHPVDRFLECAISNGMTRQDYNTTWVVTDDVDYMLENASPMSRLALSHMHLPTEKIGCRGPCGDHHAVETMYSLSRCKRAILTFGSSFGSCITSLAGMQGRHQYRVGRFGDCHRLPSDEPYDMNTLSRYGNTATYMAQMGT